MRTNGTMSRITDPISSATGRTTDSIGSGHVCPFCGLTREVTDHFDPASPCPRCTLPDTSATRNATRLRVGPWFVRQVRNPWAPGMRFETLLALIKRGQVTRDSIVRGPTTQQLWRRAAEVKGLSREFGLCHSCAAEITTQSATCPQCNRLQEPPANPDALLEARDFANAVAPKSAPASEQLKPSLEKAAGRQESDSSSPAPATASSPQHPGDEGSSTFEMASSGSSPDDLMAMTEDQTERARQITSRSPSSGRARTELRPVPEGAEDALLTPQELAAAFHLDFSPSGQSTRPSGRGRRRLALVVVLLVVGASALLYLRPDLRAEAGEWGARTVGSVKDFIASRTAPATPAGSATPTEPAVPKPPTAPTEPASTPRVADVQASPRELVEPAEPQVATGKVAVDPTPSPTTPVAVEATTNAEAAVDTRSAYDQAKDLWRRAIDAEANQDYVEAVNCYEQIKKLPSDVRPDGLEVRLQQARKLTSP